MRKYSLGYAERRRSPDFGASEFLQLAFGAPADSSRAMLRRKPIRETSRSGDKRAVRWGHDRDNPRKGAYCGESGEKESSESSRANPIGNLDVTEHSRSSLPIR